MELIHVPWSQRGFVGLSRSKLHEATRHGFASQWVMAGGSIVKRTEILGHSSVAVTERYAHLEAELFTRKHLGTIALDFAPGYQGPRCGP